MPLDTDEVTPTWERVTLDEASRLRANGETQRCLEHAKKLKQQGADTSVDEPWSVDTSLMWRDRYVVVTSVIYLVPKYLVLIFPILMLQVPFLILLRVYVASLPIPCDTPDRTSCRYQVYVWVSFVLALPMLILAFLSYLLDCLAYYMFGTLFCTLTCEWGSYCRSYAAIAPYRNGPWIMFNWSDVVSGLMGQLYRHGLFEGTVMLANMWLLMPWMKYYVNCNPFTHPLEERLITQISTSMQDMTLVEIANAGLQIMSRTKQEESLQGALDKWRFVPHYPYPPPWKRWTIGVQAGGNWIPACFFLLVHTTHALCKHCDSTEQLVISSSIAAPLYRVMLWYNNPYHFFTGWVEASITTGKPSQRDKNRGGEHPMWLVTSRSPLLSARGSLTGTGWIDNFFDGWLPRIVDGIRGINRSQQAVRDLHEEVISKDGASRPAQGKTVPSVPAGLPDGAIFDVDKLPAREGMRRRAAVSI
mmetsp:Transcript_100710/g.293497  ORF Transcript_100710/g.293497 Transcript_100710/m.293497 type:complete len:474 (+) Transcript_100710:64-1485(+)